MFDIDETPIDSFIALSRQQECKEHGVELAAGEVQALVAEIQHLQGYTGTLEAEVEILQERVAELEAQGAYWQQLAADRLRIGQSYADALEAERTI